MRWDDDFRIETRKMNNEGLEEDTEIFKSRELQLLWNGRHFLDVNSTDSYVFGKGDRADKKIFVSGGRGGEDVVSPCQKSSNRLKKQTFLDMVEFECGVRFVLSIKPRYLRRS